MQHPPLETPATYYPFRSGQYQVNANLKRLGFDFGNAEADQHIFQVDDQWHHYISSKKAARDESESKYICFEQFDNSLQKTLNLWLIDQLCLEHPLLFSKKTSTQQEIYLTNHITSETLVFNKNALLISPSYYINGFDALAMQVQEDIAIVKVANNGSDNICALHLCAPNHWAAEEKIGKSFIETHQPVANFESIALNAVPLIKNMLKTGSFVRFAWGIATDKHLNHHPNPPTSQPSRPDWQGRLFNSQDAEAYLRIERQVLTGFPNDNAFAFTIRTYFHDIATLSRQDKQLLAQAISSMNEKTLIYKGLDLYHRELVAWLKKMA